MNSSPTPNFQTRSRHLERVTCRLATLAAVWLVAGLAQAHGDAVDVLPDTQGVRLGVATALVHVDADQTLPSARLAGYLLQGDPGVDRREDRMEHAVLDAAWRLNDHFGAGLGVGKHGSDAAHVEAAWLQGRWQSATDDWQLTLGRQNPALGPVMTDAGHLDRFALMPLAKQLALNGDWMDDGIQLGWQRATPSLQWSADLCDLFGVPASALPAVQPSSGRFGLTSVAAGCPEGIPISGVAGERGEVGVGEWV